MVLEGLNAYVEQVRADWNNIGVALAVVRGNEAIYLHGFGVREHGRADLIDADTLFQIGSTTKAFAAAALGVLVDEGKVRWDDPVLDYWPRFQLRDPWLTRNVTIRDTLTHRTGFSFSPYPYLAVMDLDEALLHLRHIEPEGAFRDSCIYSNLMYAVSSKVVEAASGMSWHEFVKKRLLEPLRMSRSGTSPYEFWDREHVAPTYLGSAPGGLPNSRNARHGNVAMPHGRNEAGSAVVLPWQCYDNAAPAGSLVSSAADMANWLIVNLNQGYFGRQPILKKETVQELHGAQNLRAGTPLPPFEGRQMSYAMGWWRARYEGHLHLVHSGGIVGFPAYAALLPDRQLGIVVLANSSHPVSTLFHKSIACWALDRLLGLPLRDWSRELLPRARAAQREAHAQQEHLSRSRQVNTRPSQPLERYAGEYRDSAGSTARVRVNLQDGELVLSFSGEGAYRAQLEHWHHDVFRLRSSVSAEEVLGPSFAEFTVNATGKVASMAAFGATLRHVS